MSTDAEQPAPKIRRLAIVGLGLMGGSLGLAARQRGAADEVVGSARREETRRDALRRGVVDRAAAEPEEAVRGADVAVFCLPVLSIAPAVRRCLPHLARGCVVTDVGSTKAALVDELGPLLAERGCVFVGSHPIAGSDASGLDAARAELYQGALTVVTPAASGAGTPVVSALWRAVGARVAVMDAREHDRLLARTSHLPHLVASVLVGAVCREPGIEAYCGTGFRDATRIAAGDEALWHDIFLTNRDAVLAELRSFGSVLERVRAMLEEGDFQGLQRFLAETSAARRSFDGGAS